jgi:hypothetical protein
MINIFELFLLISTYDEPDHSPDNQLCHHSYRQFDTSYRQFDTKPFPPRPTPCTQTGNDKRPDEFWKDRF